MKFIETEIGFELKVDQFQVFFGKKGSDLIQISSQYPSLDFKSVHQVHGNTILKTSIDSDESRKADAHWTAEKNLGLLIKTADCIPIMAFSKGDRKVVAIHAGWRGVQNRIIPNYFKCDKKDWQIFIGPHILRNSFQVQQDCLNLLKECTDLAIDEWYTDERADLLKIVLRQLEECGIFKEQVTHLSYDTFRDTRFHSFRRDREAAGRQLSFISIMD